jgi:hypothetical protein
MTDAFSPTIIQVGEGLRIQARVENNNYTDTDVTPKRALQYAGQLERAAKMWRQVSELLEGSYRVELPYALRLVSYALEYQLYTRAMEVILAETLENERLEQTVFRVLKVFRPRLAELYDECAEAYAAGGTVPERIFAK